MSLSADTPRVTVLMPVYNAAATVREAVDSVLAQTYGDFEFLIIDDGSSDETARIVRSYDDPRIRSESNGQNLGVVRTLNKGLDLARGEYLVRMDADDVSLPDRLARQVAFMDEHPTVGACGSWVVTMGDKTADILRYPCAPEDIKAHLLFYNVIVHPSVCLRQAAFPANELRYDEGFPHAEDFELWQRACRAFPLANIDRVLLRHRIHEHSVTRRNQSAQAETLRRIDYRSLMELGIDPDEEQLSLHRRISEYGQNYRDLAPDAVEGWLLRLIEANDHAGVFSPRALQHVCGKLWFRYCRVSLESGERIVGRFMQSRISRYVEPLKRAGMLAIAARSAITRRQV